MSRATTKDKVDWLLAHQDVWDGFPNEFPAGTKTHHRRVFEAMQAARLFGAGTIPGDVNIAKLVDRARFIRRMGQEQPKPANN